MVEQKVILVTGGTGNQGGAIARKLVSDQQWKVKVLTRDPNSEKSKELRSLGIEILQGDLDDKSSYQSYLKDVYGVFSVQNFIYGIEKEILQGKLLADAVNEAGVQSFVYSSVSGADKNTGIPHFDSKFQIEEHIKSIGIPYCIIRPTSFYENLLNPEVKKRILKGKLVMPLSREIHQEYISLEDIALVGHKVFNNPAEYQGRTITIASDSMDMLELTNLLSQTLGRKVKYEKLPGIITRLVMGKNLHKMFRWLDKNQPRFEDDLDWSKKEFSGMTNMKTWLAKEFGI